MPVPSHAMRGSGKRRKRIVALGVIALSFVLSACTAEEPAPPADTSGPTSVPPLGVRLAKVDAAALKGRLPKGPFEGPAQEITETLSLMYTSGFVDPAQWQAGFPGVLDAFAPAARKQARENLNQLTLGGAARSLTSMLPIHARVVVRFLPDQKRTPVAAVADMRFKGMASGDGIEVPVRHEGDYLMRKLDGKWLIVGYEVRGRVGE
jgi:hypothetical protein